jgi:hypothetical protein
LAHGLLGLVGFKCKSKYWLDKTLIKIIPKIVLIRGQKEKRAKSFSPRISGIYGILEEEQVLVRQKPFQTNPENRANPWAIKRKEQRALAQGLPPRVRIDGISGILEEEQVSVRQTPFQTNPENRANPWAKIRAKCYDF